MEDIPNKVSCGYLAKLLTVEGGLSFTAMQIGKVRKKVCDDEDVTSDGKILPSGVVKICKYLDQEIGMRKEAESSEVICRVLHQKTNNPRFVVAQDVETKKRCLVGVPVKRQKQLQRPGLLLKCERIVRNGEYFYNWKG